MKRCIYDTPLSETIRLIEIINGTSSNNIKEAVIRTHLDNKLFVSVIDYLVNINPKIGRIKLKRAVFDMAPPKAITDFAELSEYLRKHTKGNDTDILTVQQFIKAQPYEEREDWMSVICKDIVRLDCKATVNKILKETEDKNESTYFKKRNSQRRS